MVIAPYPSIYLCTLRTNKYKPTLITFVFLLDFNKPLNTCNGTEYIIETLCSEPFKETFKFSRFVSYFFLLWKIGGGGVGRYT